MVISNSGHTVRQFDQELGEIQQLVQEMGRLVQEQIQQAVTALEKADVASAGTVVAQDHVVNGFEVRIDEETLSVIARRQPAASDLRLLMSISKTVTDLERIGDEAEKIGRMTQLLNEHGRLGVNGELLLDVSSMAKLALEMVHGVLDAFAHLDMITAATIAQGDRELDQEFRAALRRLITYMMEDPRVIGQAIDILFVIKALERMGDHAKNIAEYVIYLVKGKDVRHVSLEQLGEEVEGTA
jgi:phosphate transport system protein